MKPTLVVTTESGSRYEFSEGMTHVRRVTTANALRRDGEWVVLEHATIEYGEPMRLVLFGLGDDLQTVRVTTAVTGIEGVE